MGNVNPGRDAQLLFTRGARKTWSSPTLRRGWRAGSRQLCLPTSDSFQG